MEFAATNAPQACCGKGAALNIEAKPKWNETQFKLKKGRTYRFVASGAWFDASIASGPEGYKSPNFFFRLLEPFRRAPDSNWFCLIGALDRDASTFFAIGRDTTWQAPRDGALTCFANDLPFMYGNNSGSVQLDVLELHQLDGGGTYSILTAND